MPSFYGPTDVHNEGPALTDALDFIESEGQKLLPADVDPFVHALALAHPSLDFVKGQPQFFWKYVGFVITWLFFTVDAELRGSLGIHQMRKHDLAGIFWRAARMADLNEIHSLFGAQHFSVSYYKFWELDLDCDRLL